MLSLASIQTAAYTLLFVYFSLIMLADCLEEPDNLADTIVDFH